MINRSHFTSNLNHKGGLNMAKLNNKGLLALLTILLSLVVTACGGDTDYNGNTAAVDPLEVTVRQFSGCEGTVDAAVYDCDANYNLKVSFKAGLNEQGGAEVYSEEKSTSWTSTSNETLLVYIVPDNIVDVNKYVTAYLGFEGVSLPSGFEFRRCNSNGDPSVVPMVGDTETCVEIVQRDGGSGGSGNGTGTGSLCVDGDANSASNDLSGSCVITVDGQVATPDADADGLCPDGVLLTGLDAKTSSIAVTCEDENLAGDITTGVPEDTVTDVTVPLEDTSTSNSSTHGGYDVSVKDAQGNPLTDCTFDVLQLPVDPTAMDVSGECEASDGCYRFEGVKAGSYDFQATCGGLSGQRSVSVVAGETQHVWMTLLADIPDGELCVGKLGLPLDLDTPVASMQMWIGYGALGGCQAATDAEYAAMSVIDLTGPDCTDLNDPNCTVSPLGTSTDPQIDGEYQHLLWTVDLTGYADREQRVFAVTVEDGNGSTVVVHLHSLSGYFQGSTD